MEEEYPKKDPKEEPKEEAVPEEEVVPEDATDDAAQVEEEDQGIYAIIDEVHIVTQLLMQQNQELRNRNHQLVEQKQEPEERN